MAPTAEELLAVDEGRAIAAAEGFVRGLCDRHEVGGVILGLSGGLDSSVLACIAVRALGASSVRALYLHDRDHPPDPGSDAANVSGLLGIELESMSIEPEDEEGVPGAPRGPALLRVSASLNRLLYRSYRIATGETPFESSLRFGGGTAGGSGVHDRARRAIGRITEEIFERRHIRRRRLLETTAEDRGLLALGGANRTEWETGWFVSGGIDDLPHQPLIGLYKTQVRMLARRLGVPARIMEKSPSPDMLAGVDDEFAMGLDYGRLDIALDVIDGGTGSREAEAAGVKSRHIERTARLHELSRWKRRKGLLRFPVDGGKDGGLRR
jgi:NAD+ synthase